VVYEAGRSAARLTRDELLHRLVQVGLRPVAADWSQYPVTTPFFPRLESVTEISRILAEGGVRVLVGIGGCGKTTLAAEAALRAASDGHRSCWIRVSEFLEPLDLVRTVAAFCVARGLPSAGEALKTCEAARLAKVMAEAASKSSLPLVLDRFEAASPSLAAFVRDFLMSLPRTLGPGGIVLVSRQLPVWWPDFLLDHPTVETTTVGSLPVESAIAMLSEIEIGLDEEERRQLVVAVGAHAQSLRLLRHIHSAPDAPALTRQGVEIAREWVVRRVLDELPEREKTGMARIAIFDYAAPVEDVHVVLGELGPDAVRALQRRDLVRIIAGKLTVHDVVRTAALALISEAAFRRCHGLVAEHLQRGLEEEFGRNGSVLYEHSVRWASHLEKSDLGSGLGGRMAIILAAGLERLRDLFAISRLSFPFEFEDEQLVETISRIECLQDEGLIEENPVEVDQEFVARSCFMFGHACPGGREQADSCRAAQEFACVDATADSDAAENRD
jgi:hypothetical protein